MQTLNQTTLLTGVLAGMTAALLVLGANAQPSFASFMYAASALPILIAGLGWGNAAAIMSVLTAAALGAAFVSPMFAVAAAIFTLIPAGWISHLANLARPASELGGPDDLLAWYPLSDILMHLCALVAIAVIILGIMIGYSQELTDQMVDLMMATLKTQEPQFAPDPEAIQQAKSMLVLSLPMIQGGLWVILLFASYYIASRVVALSGRKLRPREDIPSTLRMNRNAIFVFLAGIVATFLGGVPAMIGATLCGTFGAGFLMSGFASLHFRTRGKDWRLPVLILAYLSAIMVLPAFLILVLGLADMRRAVALTPPTDKNTPNNSNQPD